MSKVSRVPVPSKESERIRLSFLQTLARLKTSEEVEEFLQDFLTYTEWKMFAKRLGVAEMLLEEETYAIIKSTLKVSNGTITRMQNFLQLRGAGLRKALHNNRRKSS